MAWQPNPLMAGFDQGGDGTDAWNKLTPDDARGPLTIDPQGAALARQFYAIRDSIAGEQAPIWNPNNPVGTETLQSVGMPQPTTYAGPVGQFIDPATGRMTTQGQARMDNPAMGFDTGGIGGMAEHFISYHGSPHDFPPLPGKPYGAFSDAAIGSGEGAQAYGMGHYTADAEGVARGYRDALSSTNPTVNHYMKLAQGDRQAALSAFDRDVGQNAFGFNIHPEELAHIRTQLETPPGHMYEVQVHADPAHFLDWDTPMARQSDHVINALKQANGIASEADLPASIANLTGQQLYEKLSKAVGGQHQASSILQNKYGIPGIRYLDAGSRGAGEGSRNSVVFDAANMEIIRKYGLAGLMAGGGAAALSGQQGQQQQ